MDPEIHDNAALHRYEIEVDGVTAYVRYRREPGVITFIHTEVPEGACRQGHRLAPRPPCRSRRPAPTG